MRQPVFETDQAKLLFRPCEGVRAPREFERNGNIFKRGHGWNKMERLEHDPYMIAAEARQRILAKLCEILSRAAHGA